MPLYIDDVEANVTAAGPATEEHDMTPEQFQRLIAAVVVAIEEQAHHRDIMDMDATLGERSRPPSIGD